MNEGKPPKRRGTRREQADESRRKVLTAAYSTFLEYGYHGATMAEIAARSGLAVQTVSYFFGTKPRLLSELVTAAVRFQMGDAPPLESDKWERAVDRADTGAHVLETFVDLGHEVLRIVSPLMDVARIGGLTDPDVAEVHRFHEAWRRRDFEHVVGVLEERGALKEGLAAPRAADVMLSVFGPELYLAFSRGRGWSDDEIKAWMRGTLVELLLRPPSAAASTATTGATAGTEAAPPHARDGSA